MLYPFKKIKFIDKEALVLNFSESEVLIFINDNCIKWVDKSLIEDF
ncbi:MAG TPA: hypothetical protein VHT34_10475 [Clostridia bacterium]|nr:hypothetical protein [Clostridia bacterium]